MWKCDHANNRAIHPNYINSTLEIVYRYLLACICDRIVTKLCVHTHTHTHNIFFRYYCSTSYLICFSILRRWCEYARHHHNTTTTIDRMSACPDYRYTASGAKAYRVNMVNIHYRRISIVIHHWQHKCVVTTNNLQLIFFIRFHINSESCFC